MAKTVSLKEFRPNLPKFVDEVDKKMERIFVTRYGHPVGVFMSVEELEGLEETIDIMSDKGLVKRLRKARKEAKQGKTYPLEEVRRRLGRV